MSEEKCPVLGISVGDPGGIGPEISAKALNREDIYDHCRPLVVADANNMEDVLRFTDVNLKINPVRYLRDAIFKHGTIDVLDLDNTPILSFEFGGAASGRDQFGDFAALFAVTNRYPRFGS